jgi:hypothetical protein
MPFDRLPKLEKQLKLLFDQLDEKETAKITAAPGTKTIIQQQIETELLPQIQDTEQKYLLCLSQEAQDVEFKEADAQAVVDAIALSVQQVQPMKYADPDRVMVILREIQGKLDAPGPTVGGKLKLTLSTPSFLPFVALSYEGEVDVHGLVNRHFPTFKRLALGAVKK